MNRSDPARLTAAQRLAEIADLLACGFLRLVATADQDLAEPESTRNRLAAGRRPEAPCPEHGSTLESQEPAA